MQVRRIASVCVRLHSAAVTILETHGVEKLLRGAHNFNELSVKVDVEALNVGAVAEAQIAIQFRVPRAPDIFARAALIVVGVVIRETCTSADRPCVTLALRCAASWSGVV